MAKIIWLEDAVHDLVALRNSIAHDQEHTLIKRTAEAIEMSISVLANNSYLGNSIEYLPDYRDWVIPFGTEGYIIRYRIYNNDIYIVQVLQKQEAIY